MSKRAARHIAEMGRVITFLRLDEIDAAYEVLAGAFRNDRGVYLCGNGGSASTASHFAVDLGRAIRSSPGPRIRVVSLTDNVPWLTAVSNDDSFANCFADQLCNHLRTGDVLVGISASGDSENVVRAFEYARGVPGTSRLALIGFDGGRLADLATHCIWVDSYDYGIVESAHLFVGHLLAGMLGRGSCLQDVASARGKAGMLREATCLARDIPVAAATVDAAAVVRD